MEIADPQADADAARRRVEDALSGHLRAVGPVLVERGLGARTALGLWHAAMGSLLHGVGTEAAAKLIALRAKSIRGHGANADVASSDLSPETEVQVLEEISAAAAEFVEAIGDAYEDAQDADLEHLFAEVLVDVLARTLVGVWGPFHARKALGEQWIAFSAGRETVVHPAEPDELLRPRPSERPPEARVERAPSPALGRTAPERHVDMRVEAEVEGPSGAFAVAMETSERGGRRERRDIVGPCTEASVRKAVLAAAVEGMRAVAETAGKVVVRVASSAAFLQTGMAVPERRPATARLASEEGMWSLLDGFAATNRIEWRHASGGLSDDLAERCDRLIRRQLAV
jgi:ribonuclease HI